MGRSEACTILNVPYAVMLGVLLNFTFKLKSNYLMMIPFHENSAFLFWSLLLFYYLLSWYVHNFHLNSFAHVPLFLVFLWTLAGWFLGIIILMAKSESIMKFLLFSLYILIVGCYDIIFMRTSFYKQLIPPFSIVWLFLSGFTILFGMMLLLPVILCHAVNFPEYKESFYDTAIPITIFFIVIRVGRFFYTWWERRKQL